MSRRVHTFKDLPPAISVRWLAPNQAYAVMWHDQVLRVLNTADDVEDYLKDLRRPDVGEELSYAERAGGHAREHSLRRLERLGPEPGKLRGRGGKLHVERVRINRQGYDSAGRYYGVGQPLFRVSGEGSFADVDEHVRAKSAKEARNIVGLALGRISGTTRSLRTELEHPRSGPFVTTTGSSNPHTPGNPPPPALWSVQLKGDAWYVVHPTKGQKRIGTAGKGRGVNYHDKAVAEAERRNRSGGKRAPGNPPPPGSWAESEAQYFRFPSGGVNVSQSQKTRLWHVFVDGKDVKTIPRSKRWDALTALAWAKHHAWEHMARRPTIAVPDVMRLVDVGVLKSKKDVTSALHRYLGFTEERAAEHIAQQYPTSWGKLNGAKHKPERKRVAKKKAAKTERVCSSSGYAYELQPPDVGPGDATWWRRAKDDFWDTVMIREAPVKVLGKRYVDGSEVMVFKLGSKVYAQTALHVKKC